MRNTAGKDDELKQIREELAQLARDMRAAFQKTAPVFRVSLEQMRMAVQNVQVGLRAFGEELRKAMEKWANDEGDDGAKTGAKK